MVGDLLGGLEWGSSSTGAEPRQAVHHFSTDASRSVGCGALWGFRGLQLSWQLMSADAARGGRLSKESTTPQELLSVVLASAVWGREWQKTAVLVYIDNVGAVISGKIRV